MSKSIKKVGTSILKQKGVVGGLDKHHYIPLRAISYNKSGTDIHSEFRKDLAYHLNEIVQLKLVPTMHYSIDIELGFNNSSSDVDNAQKSILDVLKYFGADDKCFKRLQTIVTDLLPSEENYIILFITEIPKFTTKKGKRIYNWNVKTIINSTKNRMNKRFKTYNSSLKIENKLDVLKKKINKK